MTNAARKAAHVRVKKIAHDTRNLTAYDGVTSPPDWRPFVAELADEVAKILALPQRRPAKRKRTPVLQDPPCVRDRSTRGTLRRVSRAREGLMTRVEFKLAMPGRGSWDGRWDGEGQNYMLVQDLDGERASQLDGQSWTYSWLDGWRAQICARIVPEGETLTPSHGFKGYDWMVASILQYGTIYADHERPDTRAQDPRP